jgi:hypothetical protein
MALRHPQHILPERRKIAMHTILIIRIPLARCDDADEIARHADDALAPVAAFDDGVFVDYDVADFDAFAVAVEVRG